MKQTTVTAVSDLHGDLTFTIPATDVLAISGDLCPVNESHHPAHQRHWLERKFRPWCQALLDADTVKDIVFTPGNHDFVFASGPAPVLGPGVTCLIDTGADIQGLRFYGTPWTPVYGKWAFMKKDEQLEEVFAGIPGGLDVLLSHGPAYGICDTILKPAWAAATPPSPLGSMALLKALLRARPLWTFCGHIHTGNHDPVAAYDGGYVANVSLLDESYERNYQPLRVLFR